jgi:hypothetical protein
MSGVLLVLVRDRRALTLYRHRMPEQLTLPLDLGERGAGRPDGPSWFRAGSRVLRVTECFQRRLWDEIEAAFLRWCSLGRPSQERFGVTVDGTELRVWLDEPSRVIR